jgi:hypothetical protein
MHQDADQEAEQQQDRRADCRMQAFPGERLGRVLQPAHDAETAAMLFWGLLASGQISMRKVDGWHTLGQPPAKSMIDLAA